MLRPWSASFITKKKSYTPVIDAIFAHCKTVIWYLSWMLTPHSNTDTPGTVTCLPVAAVRSARAGSVVLLLGLECLKLSAGASFFRGTHLVTDLNPLAPHYGPSGKKSCAKKRQKTIPINRKLEFQPYIRSGTSISLFTANFVAVRGTLALMFLIVW